MQIGVVPDDESPQDPKSNFRAMDGGSQATDSPIKVEENDSSSHALYIT